MKTLLASILLLFVLVFSGCAEHQQPQVPTKGSVYPHMYTEHPRSLLILPPINESTDAQAKEYYMTTVEVPFAQKGYYVFPVELVSEMMKQEGVYDTELLYSMPTEKFAEYFGADAVLFTRIKKWDMAYAVVASSLTVSIEAMIKSTKSSQTLWHHTGTVFIDLSSRSGDNSLLGVVIDAIATAISSAAADYIDYAHVANKRLIRTLPVGPYHSRFQKDQNDPLR